LEAAGATHEIHSFKAFVSSPQPLFVRILWFMRKPKWWVERILFVSTWAFELYEAVFVVFVTLGDEAS
jgi:hypothetical protein